MNKSFTLIEILVVIVVIGIISSFIIVGLSSVSDKANIAKGQAFSNSLRNSLLMNLVSEWKLDEGTGSTTLDSWGSNTGTLGTSTIGDAAEPTWTTDCVSGKCLSFDGTDDYVDCGNPDNLNNITEYVISFWIKTNQIPTTNTHIIWKENSPWKYISIRLDSSGRVRFVLYDGTNNPGVWSDIVLNNNKYHYIVAMRKSGKIYLYRDTIINEATDTTLSSYTTTLKLTVGAGYGSGGISPFSGIIDELVVYNAPMSFSKIKQNYYLGLNKLLLSNKIIINEFNKNLGKI